MLNPQPLSPLLGDLEGPLGVLLSRLLEINGLANDFRHFQSPLNQLVGEYFYLPSFLARNSPVRRTFPWA